MLFAAVTTSRRAQTAQFRTDVPLVVTGDVRWRSKAAGRISTGSKKGSMTTTAVPSGVLPVVDLTPLRVIFRAYQGDPFDVRIAVTIDGAPPPDLSGWNWSALIAAGGQEIPFACDPEVDGVSLYLRGVDTARLGTRYWPFDVTGRDPDAGEGRTLLRGSILALERITPPLRGAADQPLVEAAL